MPLSRPFLLAAAAGVAAAAAIVAGVLILVPDADDPGAPLLRPDDPVIVAGWRALYETHCASCHGEALQGQPDWQRRRADGRLPAPPHDETGHTWHHPDAVLFALTKFGPARVIGDPTYASDMPGYETVLADGEIIAVLSYIKSTWPDEIRRRHDRMNGEARQD